MKKATLFIASAAIVLTSACKKEQTLKLQTEEPLALNTTTTTTTVENKGVNLLNYTVHVVDPTTAGKTSAAGLSGATVVLVGNGGAQSTATTNSNGTATFTSLVEGIVTVDVSLTGYTNVHYIASLYNQNVSASGTNDVIENAFTDIALWPMTATAEGYVVGDYVNDGDCAFDAPGCGRGSRDSTEDKTQVVTVIMDIMSSQPYQITGAGKPGEIIDSYIVPSRFTTTSTVNTGSFKFTALPGTADGSDIMANISTVPTATVGLYTFSIFPTPITTGWLQVGTTQYIGVYYQTKQKTVY